MDWWDYQNGRGGVETNDCDNLDDQKWKLYENGELVNMKSGLCLDVNGEDGWGNVNVYYCENSLDQMWNNNDFRNGDYFAFVNKKNRAVCLDVEGSTGRGNVQTQYCDHFDDQYWKFDNNEWVAPTASWNKIACNQNG